MKILYVEDELTTKNLDRIENLFEKCLEPEILAEIKVLKSKQFPPNEIEIKEVLNKSLILEVEYSFPNALEKVLKQGDDYSLFIVDRDLSQQTYELKNLQKIDPSFDESKLKKFEIREGDYLLTKLVYEANVLDKFYFLTANLDEMRGFEEIQNHIDAGKFRRENFFEKGKMESLKKIIDNFEVFKIQMDNQVFLEILNKYLTNEDRKDFISVLLAKDQDSKKEIKSNLGDLRILLEEILKKVAVFSNPPRSLGKYPDGSEIKIFRNDGKLVISNFIKWLNKENELGFNRLLEIFAKDCIHGISSKYGTHKDRESKIETNENPLDKLEIFLYQPTTNTVNSLIFALKEIILWFGEVCEQENKF